MSFVRRPLDATGARDDERVDVPTHTTMASGESIVQRFDADE